MAAENKMGTQPVGRLLLAMSVPIMISMFVQALYNIVDSIFVAQISEHALTAVSLAFPWQNLMISVGVGTGVGVNACLSKALGAGKPRLANSIARNALFLALASYVVFGLLGASLCSGFYHVQTDVSQIITYGESYMLIISLFSVGMFYSCITEKLLTSTGRTGLTMLVQLSGAFINILLDPILIFGLFGFPRLEVAGAAIATVAGQICAGLLGLYLNHRHNPELALEVSFSRPSLPIVRRIYAVGLPSIVMQSIGSAMTFGMNLILISFSTTAAAVFGIYFKLHSFAFLPVFGLNNGVVPIVAYNYGALRPKRIMQAWRWGVLYAFVILTCGMLIFQSCTGGLLALFSASEQMVQIGVPALRTIAWSFPVAAFLIITSAFFQALGHGIFSMWISVIRQLAALLPLAWLFAQTGSLDLIWWAFPISELIAGILCLGCFVHIYRSQVQPLFSDLAHGLPVSNPSSQQCEQQT